MITIDRLSRRYGSFTAVDDISFEVRPGSVTGFLGPNGAGKSTAMRMMVGLTPPSSGAATVLGRPYRSLPNPGREVGVLLDAGAQHGGRTGREVLTLAAVLMGVGRARVDAMLALVGLSPTEARRRVKHYSLGMRQRLGIAHALLGDPQVLILDEPANGLDPAGIHWMRGLLRDFAARGGTVLLSSHLLHEVEVVADELVLIGRGRIVAQGAKTELLASTSTVVGSDDLDVLADALEAAGITVTRTGGRTLVAAAPLDRVGRLAAAERLALTELRASEGGGLEQMFLELTADDAREAVGA
ncbi:ABC-2 type transport system ATP-binding protein [Friedmanniella luteola]|uniref:ABC-2 type transport system ATP-binding protein n=1 Tax=Friedmanniella luteola TaxID=546871 RepID=A0A1H1Z460_9ACTN|nr:ATP-binding cassette domain-containing protein [Friedmanniella luteola]SDT28389.1 ABC-2 type transport system ATP-binding protein [Friedmanniella luteola]